MSDDEKKIITLGNGLPKARRNRESRPVTVDEAREWITAGSIAAMKQVYEQLAAESEKNFAELEDVVVDRVLAEIARRSWRGRVKAWWVRRRAAHVVEVP